MLSFIIGLILGGSIRFLIDCYNLSKYFDTKQWVFMRKETPFGRAKNILRGKRK